MTRSTGTPKNLAQITLEPHELKQGRRLVVLDQDIQIALRRRFPADIGSEHTQRTHRVARGKIGLVPAQHRQDIIQAQARGATSGT